LTQHTVRAAVQVGPRQIEVREFDRPATGPDDGLLRIERCGICGSDVEQFKGELGRRSYRTPSAWQRRSAPSKSWLARCLAKRRCT